MLYNSLKPFKLGADGWQLIVYVLLYFYCRKFNFEQVSYVIFVTADSSQTWIFEKVDGQVWHARWWLLSSILDTQTLLHFGPGEGLG